MTWIPRLTLQTLGRGDGLLGMRPSGPFGPRGEQVTLCWMDEPVPASAGTVGDIGAIDQLDSAIDTTVLATAHDRLRSFGLHPVPPKALQWRAPSARAAAGLPGCTLWSLPQEDQFGDFWAEQLPLAQAEGWRIVVRPGFAHESVPVQAWRLLLEPPHAPVALPAREVAAPMQRRPGAISALRHPYGEGSWMLSLGVEIEGQRHDLAPLLAELLAREPRWLSAHELQAIADDEVIKLRAPGGRRVHAPAAPLKAIVRSMLDLLTDPRRREGPFEFTGWDAHRLEALRLALGDDPADQAARAGTHGAWALQGEVGLHELAQRLKANGAAGSVPSTEGLGITLRPYQLNGVAWLQRLREQHLAGILADDMGLGKTAQTLAHVLIEQRAGRLHDAPALVVVPASLLFNWQAEAARMAPDLRVLTLQGPRRAQAHSDIDGHHLVLISYPLLWRDIRALEARPWHLLILDEAQFVKNAGTRTARAVRRIPARHRLCLTGTPLENHLGELWAQFDFLLPGFLGDRRHFQAQYRRPIEKSGETGRAALLAARVRPFILRRRKDQVELDLPPLTETTVRLGLQGGQRDLYESVRLAVEDEVRKLIDRKRCEGAQIGILDALLKLRQVCCDPRLVKGPRSQLPAENAKLEWLREHLPEMIEQGRRLLIFSQFTELLELLAPELDALQLPWLALTGQTPPAKRGALITRYQNGEVPILLASLKAGGVGLNLTAADTVIHLDPWWNPAVMQQATARAHRIGQSRPVFAYSLVIEGSIEERLLALQSRKQALADGVLGVDAALAVKFGSDELQALLAPLR